MKEITVSGRTSEYDEATMRQCFAAWLEWTGNSDSGDGFDWFVQEAHDPRSHTFHSVCPRHFREIYEAGRESIANAGH